MNIKSDDIILAWNQRVGKYSAHIEAIDIEEMHRFYESACQGYDFNGKKIVDYGAGGGLFMDWIFSKFRPNAYFAFDIADRQLAILREKAKGKDNVKIGKIDPLNIPNLNQENEIDVLTFIEVLHHSATKEYFEYILSKINESKIKTIILSYKHAEKTIFRDKPYKTTHDIGHACYTNQEEILKCLTNYKLHDKFENGNRFLRLVLKKQKRSEHQANVD